jgi:hypothetical protein
MINIIVGGLRSNVSKRRYRKDKHEVHLVHTQSIVPLCWSEQAITFSRADHWVHIPDPGSYPLVVEPTLDGTLLSQTLIDGGSWLNIIFVETPKKMNFNFDKLIECSEPFYIIIPGKATYPLGWVSLHVTFGTEANFRMEYINFEVTNFKSPTTRS